MTLGGRQASLNGEGRVSTNDVQTRVLNENVQGMRTSTNIDQSRIGVQLGLHSKGEEEPPLFMDERLSSFGFEGGFDGRAGGSLTGSRSEALVKGLDL